MKKILISSIVVYLSFVGISFSADYSWKSYTDTRANELRIYRSTASLVCNDEMWVVPINETTKQINSPANGFYFLSIQAIDTDSVPEKTSGTEYEILQKYCNYELCQPEVTVFSGSDYFEVSFETPAQGGLFEIRYVNEDELTEAIVTGVTSPVFIYDVTPGTYTIEVSFIDALGRLNGGDYSNPVRRNPYPLQQITIEGNNPKPMAPVIGVESRGWGDIQTLVGLAEMSDPFVQKYEWHVYSSSIARDEAITSKVDGDVANGESQYGTAFCVDVSTYQYPAVFVRAVAIDYNGQESLSTADYRLFNDIVGFESPASEAVIDDADTLVMNTEYRKWRITKYTPRFGDICTESNPYQYYPFTETEACDFDNDLNVSTPERTFLFREILGNTAAGL